MTRDWPQDEAPIETAAWVEDGANPAPEADVLPAPSPRWSGQAPLVEHVEICPDHFRARIVAPDIARSAYPGQFLHILVSDALAPLLRRPISISRISRDGGWVEFIYRVVGEGTALLARVTVGSAIDVMGPLGTPFTLPPAGRRHIVVGGGVGIPPMFFLAEELKISRPDDTISVLLGGRHAGLVLNQDDFQSLGLAPRVITDDGSAGERGLVTDLLECVLKEPGPPPMVYACGPTPMLRAVARVSEAHGAPCQVAFEARMACGVGACLSCVIPTISGYQRVCTEGPAFPADVVIWTAELNLH